jgi:hypothetical protein
LLKQQLERSENEKKQTQEKLERSEANFNNLKDVAR